MQHTLDYLWSLPTDAPAVRPASSTAMSSTRGSSSRAMVEPTPEELQEIRSVFDLLTWAKIDGDTEWPPSMAATYMRLFGITSGTDISDFASIETEDFEAVLPTWRYSNTENGYDGRIGEEVDLDVNPSLIILGRARRCHHAARIWSKLEYSQVEIAEYAAEQQASRELRRQAKAEAVAAHGFQTGGQQVIQMLAAPKTPPGDTINLNKVVDLTKNREIPVISTDMYGQCLATYKALNWGLETRCGEATFNTTADRPSRNLEVRFMLR